MTVQVINPVTTKGQLAPFADSKALAYCKALSQALLQNPAAREHSDLMALGFWLRPANIERMLTPYKELKLRPLGHVFLVAPGTLVGLFGYSVILVFLSVNLI